MANYFKGDDLRSYFHSFGRAFTAAGQNFLDQAPLKSGHTVSTIDVRSDAVPYVDAEFKLEKDFNNVKAGTCILTGEAGSRTVIAELSSILKFYDGVTLTVMEATNGETYQLIDGGVVVKGLMDPTDQYDSTGKKTADGYTIKVLDKDNTPIPMSKGWVVDPVNGAVTFEKGKTPENQSFGAIKIVAFAYVGKTLNTTLTQYKAVDAALDTRLEVVEKQLGISDVNDGTSSLTQKVIEIEKTISAYTSTNTISGAISSLSTAIDNIPSVYGSGAIDVNTNATSSIVSLNIDPTDKVLSQTQAGLLTNISLVKLTGDDVPTGFAACYQLQGINGEVLGDTINIPKDQFLTDASYNATTQTLNFTFAISKKDADGNLLDENHVVSIDAKDLVHEYKSGNGIYVGNTQDGQSIISAVIDPNSTEKYLAVNQNGLYISGITSTISTAIQDLSGTVDSKFEINFDQLSAGINDILSGLDDEQLIRKNAISAISSFVSGLPADIAAVDTKAQEISAYVSGLPTIIDDVVAQKIVPLENAVSVHTTNIETNAANIAINAANIETNTTNIAENADAINIISGAILSGFNVENFDDIAVSGNLNHVRSEMTAKFDALTGGLEELSSAMFNLNAQIQKLKNN